MRVVFLSFVAFHFNSRPSARGDVQRLAKVAFGAVISIHAPPRGATGSVMDGYVLTSISIHAPPRGATGDYGIRVGGAFSFQFTPLREGRRRHRRRIAAARRNFNSRPSARGDIQQRAGRAGVCISIHAPPRGATNVSQPSPLFLHISIHAPPRGATLVFGAVTI